MDPFYEAMLWYLNHDRTCKNCGSRLWMSYCDGHVADKCLDCPPIEWTLETMIDLDMPGYITKYPEPKGPMPEQIETSGGGEPWAKSHEKYYRLKK